MPTSRALTAAAAGNVTAQEAMLDQAIGVLHQNDILTEDMISAVEWWARLLAANGHPQHIERLAGVLLFRSAIHRHAGATKLAHDVAEEGFAMLRHMASGGRASAETLLAELSSIVARDVGVSAAFMLGAQPSASC